MVNRYGTRRINTFVFIIAKKKKNESRAGAIGNYFPKHQHVVVVFLFLTCCSNEFSFNLGFDYS